MTKITTIEGPQIIRESFLSVQACVPKDMKDSDIVNFVEENNPAGTTNGWAVAKDEDTILTGHPARVQCQENPDKIHVILYV